MDLLQPVVAFAEGLALIASPCILPVLPLVLSASADGGRKRPFGIITGFVLSFTAFVLLSRSLVQAFHVNLDLIKYASLILLGLFGLILLSKTLSGWFSRMTQGAASAGSRIGTGGSGGYGSGVLIGSLIGLVWTPCAGPILAAVLVQVIREQSDSSSLFIVAAFALGAGAPMFLIALTGRRVMAKLGFLTAHAEMVRKGFGVLILLSVAFLASGIDPSGLFATKPDASVATAPHEALTLEHGLEKPYPAPELAGIDSWLGSPPLTLKSLRGKVVLIDFWTYSCINCVRTLPFITRWDEQYRDKGLVIIGVHAPEFEFEKNVDNVKAAIAAHHIGYPVAMDNELATWSAFQNRFWPAHYLIDQGGNVVYTHFGEGAYETTENNIRYLLGLKQKAAEMTLPQDHFVSGQTPETYLGYARGERFSGAPAIMHDKLAEYHAPASLPADHWALSGNWTVGAQAITAKAGATLRLHFNAGRVFLVLGSANGHPVHAAITLDGKNPFSRSGKDAAQGTLTVSRNTLYELLHLNPAASGEIRITAQEDGLEAYAFTFGN